MKDTLICSNKWDIRFMRLAREVSLWSKDSTKIGCVIVSPNRRIVATGYNGFPLGCDDEKIYQEIGDDKEKKYEITIHAEMNALLNALKNGVSVDGCTIYIWGNRVCKDCAKHIAQSGITTVWYTPGGKKPSPCWIESSKVAREIFDKSGVKLYRMMLKLIVD